MIVTPSNSMAEQIKPRYPSLKTKNYNTLYHGFRIEEKEVVKVNGKIFCQKKKELKYFTLLIRTSQRI